MVYSVWTIGLFGVGPPYFHGFNFQAEHIEAPKIEISVQANTLPYVKLAGSHRNLFKKHQAVSMGTTTKLQLI